jgi:hypothetical protein
MARQDTNSDLAGRLVASLTPRVTRSGAPSRREQNSGLFDMGALYTEALDQVMHRARNEVHLVPLVRSSRLPWAPASPWPVERSLPQFPRALAPELEMDVPVEFASAFEAPRSRGLGWFGVAVAWLATVTIGAILAISVPAHAFPRSRVRVVAAMTTPVPAAPGLATAPAAAWTAVPVALAAPAIPVAPVVPVVPPPPAPIAASAPRRVTRPTSAPPPPAPVVAHARPAGPSAPAPQATAVVAATPPAPQPAPEKPRVAPPVPPASTAGMSLEDLIRHEVQAESGKVRR